LSCDTKKFHDNESTHILHNFWTSTHRGEAPPLPPPWRRHWYEMVSYCMKWLVIALQALSRIQLLMDFDPTVSCRLVLAIVPLAPCLRRPPSKNADAPFENKKLSYRRWTARCVVSVEILPIATQQCRNSCITSPEQIEVMKLEG